MREYKNNFKHAVAYATHKLDNSPFKMILLGMLGSIYVGIAYLVFIVIIGSWDGVIENVYSADGSTIIYKSIHIPGLALFTAAALFPVGIILILFLGGSLFTSDNLTMLSWITKQKDSSGNHVKFRKIVIKWMYTLIGNIIGGILFGAITRAADFFANENYQLILGYICGKKLHMSWYFVIFSGFLCNILVAGSVWATLATNHSSAKILLIYFPIWLFAIAGFQHVVANAILFSMGLFYMINPSEQSTIFYGINWQLNQEAIKELGESYKTLNNFVDWKTSFTSVYNKCPNAGYYVFKVIFTNLLPAAIGNWVSGSIFLPYTYLYLSGHYKELRKLNTLEIDLNTSDDSKRDNDKS